MFRFAWASLKYHKRATYFYTFLLLIGCGMLLFLNTLIDSLPLLFDQTKELLNSSGYQERDIILQQLNRPQNDLRAVYTSVRDFRLPFFFLFILFFFVFSQIKKEQELFAWYQSGSSIFGWIRLNLVEYLSPFIFVGIIYSLLFVIFQDYMINLFLDTHLNVLDTLHDFSVDLYIASDESLNRFFVRFPTTNQALMSSMQLSSQQWYSILFTALGKTLAIMAAAIGSISLFVSGGYSYWRYQQWKKQSL